MIKGYFHSIMGAEAIGASGHHSDLLFGPSTAPEISPLALNQFKSSSSWVRNIRAPPFIGSMRLRIASEHQQSRKAPAQIKDSGSSSKGLAHPQV